MEWQLIETAPKDTTDVLLYLGPDRPPVVAGWFGDGREDLDIWWMEYDTQNVVKGKPTHWMPIPQPPHAGETE